MKIDYDVGDVVVCVDDQGDKPEHKGWGPRKGGLYRVTGIGDFGEPFLIVDLAEDPFASDEDGWEHTMFRKLPKADAGFTSLIKRKTAPKRVSENA